MAHKGQQLTSKEKQLYKQNYEKWLLTDEGKEYTKKVELEKQKVITDYYGSPKHCHVCNNVIPFEKKDNSFCSRSCSATYNNSKRIVSQEQKTKVSNTMKKHVEEGTFIYPNKQLPTLHTITCKYCHNTVTVNSKKKNNKYCSKQCYLADPNKKCGKGGYRKGSGIGKHGWYNGYWCDSSYELAFVIYNLEHNIQFSRNKQGFEYQWNNEKHLYFPDFMIDDTYIEIKGFWTEQHEAKIKAFPHKLQVFYKKDLTDILSYVITKYGEDYIRLYENNPYKDKKENICKECGNHCKNVFCCRACAGKYRAKLKHGKEKS